MIYSLRVLFGLAWVKLYGDR